MLAFSLVVSATASPLIKDCSFSMILFWVAMRLSMVINSFAIWVCSSFEGIPIYASSKLRTLIEKTFVP